MAAGDNKTSSVHAHNRLRGKNSIDGLLPSFSMDQRAIWITFSGLLVMLLLAHGLPGVSTEDVPVTQTYHTCREDNVTFTWKTNITAFYFIDLIFVPHDQVTSNSTNARSIIMSITPSPERIWIDNRYVGRLSHSVRHGVYSFKLVSVSPKDRGYYHLLVAALESFEGKSDLIVYAEDNLWPTEDPEAAARQTQHPTEESGNHRYPFIKHEESPVIGMKMSVASYDKIQKYCYFGNTSRCEIVFMPEELEELQGTIRFSVEPQFQNNSIICAAVKMPYDYKITLVGGICVSVFIAIAACVIPPIIIYVKTKRDKYLPLSGGYEFLKGCIERIEATPEVSDVYRKNANTKMIHPHIRGYFQDPKGQEGFFQDEGLTKIYFAAFIKHYITNVREPLISLDYVNKVKSGDLERDKNFNITSVRNEFAIKKGDKKNAKYRKRILRLLFQHFHWFRERKIAADGSDSEENSPSKILTTSGLAGLLAMNFDRTNSQMDMQEFDRVARFTRFLKNLIIHSDEIFGSRADANGTAMTDGTLDMTGEPLLESVA
ncbi:hypothetical protein LSH36_281g05031 [Paralvinella palmiformis]|uniref:Rho-GAP domain-containing protein n=1 Tax=Paralvinella palmiformis TaxID=53620 RepID=A0AAD9N249_9ANNE|nr:hypothetical protein LSH36_281g05031 [Paralvinella palmiformis]